MFTYTNKYLWKVQQSRNIWLDICSLRLPALFCQWQELFEAFQIISIVDYSDNNKLVYDSVKPLFPYYAITKLLR